jgi:hypothetical protein
LTSSIVKQRLDISLDMGIRRVTMLGEKDTLRAMEKKSPVSEAAAAMGRIGGPARAKALSPERRKEIARKGAAARWGKKRGKKRG